MRRIPAWGALAALVLLSTVLRAWAGLRVPTPWIAADEMIYAELGRSLWETGRLDILGQDAAFYSLLHPALIGLPLALFDGASGYEVARVIGQVLSVRTDLETQRKLLVDRLRPRLEKLEPLVPDAREVGVPAESLPWLETQARAQRDALVRAGYALHGDPDRLLPSGAATQGPDECRALALALSLLAGRS